MTDKVEPNAYQNWTPAAQEKALQRVQELTNRKWRPFYCPNALCDGSPHDDWDFNHARPDQRPPTDPNWLTWLLMSGRGTGKTRTGTEFIHKATQKLPRIALVAGTATDAREVMLEGNALALDTPVATAAGFVAMGDIEAGVEVIGPDGYPTKVTWVGPVHEGRPCYEVTFADGSVIVADAEHQWVVSNVVHPEQNTPIKTTEELVRPESDTQARWYIDVAQPIDLPDADLPVPPYTLGAWLGDGTAKGAEITTMDREVLDGVIRDGFALGYTWNNGGQASAHNVLGLKRMLRLTGLISNKHIPAEYMRASFRQRLDLLRGLMDTDGYVSERGQCAYDGVNERLVKGVAELCATLGIKANAVLNKPDGGLKPGGGRGQPVWRATFTTALPVCTVARKADRIVGPKSPEVYRHLVRSVRRCESVPVRCIAVDADHHQYLVTDKLIATHNSGLLTLAPPNHRPLYEPSKKRLTWPNGAIGTIFSAEEPDRLRGPEHYLAWLDEPAHWPLVQDCWDNLLFGLRLGARPRIIATTTPKTRKWLKELIADDTTRKVSVSTYANIDNLSPIFAGRIISRYEGTRLGRQELHGELLTDVEGAMWTWELIEDNRQPRPLRFDRIVVGIDPAGTHKKRSDETGIVVSGALGDHGYVIDDASGKFSPSEWVHQALAMYDKYSADAYVVETNFGADLVKENMRNHGIEGRILETHSSRGKELRAEPVVGLYEQGRVHHCGEGDALAELEVQMTEWVAGDRTQGSPDRVDALVFSLTEVLRQRGESGFATPAEVEEARRKLRLVAS